MLPPSPRREPTLPPPSLWTPASGFVRELYISVVLSRHPVCGTSLQKHQEIRQEPLQKNPNSSLEDETHPCLLKKGWAGGGWEAPHTFMVSLHLRDTLGPCLVSGELVIIKCRSCVHSLG